MTGDFGSSSKFVVRGFGLSNRACGRPHLGEYSKHAKECLTRRCRGIDRLLQHTQRGAFGFDFMRDIRRIAKRSAEAVEARYD
jgi:hypothetical protein